MHAELSLSFNLQEYQVAILGAAKGGTLSRQKAKHLLSLVVFFFLTFGTSCVNKTVGPQTTLSEFYVTTQVDGWVADSSSHLVLHPAADLFEAIDGGAPIYEAAGLQEWFVESLNGGPNHSPVYGDYNFKGYVEDYGTSSNARAIFNTNTSTKMVQNPRDTFSDTVQLSPFSLSEAQANRVQGGINVFANFGQVYFEFSLTGYVDPTTAAPDAIKFLTRYKALAENQ